MQFCMYEQMQSTECKSRQEGRAEFESTAPQVWSNPYWVGVDRFIFRTDEPIFYIGENRR